MSLTEETMFLLVAVCSLMSAPVLTGPIADSSYVAAVYEHKVIVHRVSNASRAEALQHIQKNLDIYEQQAAEAAKQGAQILVFPEYGLSGFYLDRSSVSSYLETIPDPQQENWNPCLEPGKYSNTEVLQRLSCMARSNNLYLVANMGDMQPCPLKTDPTSSCPPDGRWKFNTNVVFKSDGQLLARYHKYNLYMEPYFDVPPQPEIITFDTPFAGKFGTMICFDMLFHKPTGILLDKGVRQLVYPTAWVNFPPVLDSVQFHRGFSLGANVTVLSSNLRFDKEHIGGSGIYTPFSSTYHHATEGDPEEGKLVVARVPVLDPMWRGESTATEESTSPTAATSGACQHTPDPNPEIASSVPPSSDTFIVSLIEDPYTFVLLNKTEDDLKVCNGTFCCHLQYKRSPQAGSEELYALAAFSGTHTIVRTLNLQVCALVRCAGSDFTSCGQPVVKAESKIDFTLEGKFASKRVYPSVMASKNVMEEPQNLEMAADGRVTMKHSNMSGGLISASLLGRPYQMDEECTGE
ncbi:biotinidase-like [Dicentrarchus labrax]|uniref:biotinidase-like n=1 Tax=Dicentrarchus labrax TaxID=13489 RepID=UPI0021F67AD9|nr:biotinidase-like [Dicentrarchus labrax]